MVGVRRGVHKDIHTQFAGLLRGAGECDGNNHYIIRPHALFKILASNQVTNSNDRAIE